MSKFVEKCREKLDNKDLDFKIDFAKYLIYKKKISLERALELINYIFEKKEDVLKRQDDKDFLYDLAYNGCNSKNIMEGIESYIKFVEADEFDSNFFEMVEEMERKHNRWLQKGKRKRS